MIMQACVIGQGSEIFVLDMGPPVNIDFLARQYIRMAGLVPGRDIEIVYTGLRPGEKLVEELFHDEEKFGKTVHHQINLVESRILIVAQSWLRPTYSFPNAKTMIPLVSNKL